MQADDPRYKFKDIKIYGSTEWLANNEKKYRTVFDESECTYVYCEFSFYNKLFDESDWELKMQLKCFDNTKREICNLNCDRTVSKEDNICFVREGWGVKNPGTYWKRGAYKWEVWVDGKFITEKYFYIEKEGTVTQDFNPYFNIKNIKLYEGPDANLKPELRKYFKTFNSSDSRYIWIEFNAENLVKDVEYWACELTFNFKTHTGQLKGSVNKMQFIYPQEEMISITTGWGSDTKGTWGKDKYYIEVVFMDELVAVVPFDVGNDYEEATEEDFLVTFRDPYVQSKPEPREAPVMEPIESIEDVMKELDDLIGLETIRQKIKEYSSYLNFIAIRKKKGFPDTEKINLHAVFTGNPGTGKTTVARMLGKIYKQLGLLSKGHVHEVDRADLVAEYIGQTAPKTKEAIKKAKGGILFIDEAYALARKDDDSKDFGKEAIEILLKEMGDSEDFAVIVAGYPNEMETFMMSNPGLKSRFNMYYDFPDYMPQELIKIADYAAEKRSVKLSPEARDLLYKKMVEKYRERNKFFGNARMVNSMIDETKMNLGLRIMKSANPNELSMDDLSTISVADVERMFEKQKRSSADIPVDEDLLRESQGKLKSMIGLQTVKHDIDELVKLVRFYRETGKDVRQTFSLHSVFTGNPGTGKTTVARILAQVYKALGILERGHLVECDRQALVGGYIGQTALKTTEVLDRAMGGVLFIDEAYSLTDGGNSDYGREAIETILKRMEDRRGEFIVIVAGYTANMERFLESNPGLKSRFDREFHFADFNPAELLEIAHHQLEDNGIKPDAEAETHLKAYLEHLYTSKDKYFGNGRAVRKVIEEAVKNQHLRLSQVPFAERTPEMINTLTYDDVKEFSLTWKPSGGSNIGFRVSKES